MAAKTAILEINGTRYDASGSWHAARKPARSIDGLVGGGATGGLAPKPKAPLSSTVSKPTMNDVVRSGPNHLRKKPSSSKILMRQAVKKPSAAPVKHIKSQSALKHAPMKQPAHKLQTKLSVSNTNQLRAKRAELTPKSQSVTRFTPSGIITTTVYERPVLSAMPTPSSSPTAAKTQHSAPSTARKPAIATKPKAASSRRTTGDIFDEALARATSHQQPPHKPAKKKLRVSGRAIILVSTFVFVFVVSGIFASQNMGNLKMHMAGSTAGFSASLPSYQPAGYRLHSVDAQAGEVAAKFLSNSDQRAYTLTQKPSNWDSQALKEMHVTKASADFIQTEQDGQTIFMYGDRTATWVNGGIWYLLTSNGSLSDKQLAELATSL